MLFSLFSANCLLIYRNIPTRRSMVLKTATYTDLQVDCWKWEKHGEKNIFGCNLAR